QAAAARAAACERAPCAAHRLPAGSGVAAGLGGDADAAAARRPGAAGVCAGSVVAALGCADGVLLARDDARVVGSRLVHATAIRMGCFVLRVGRAMQLCRLAGLWGGSFGWSIFAGMGCDVPMNARHAGGPPRRLGAAASS